MPRGQLEQQAWELRSLHFLAPEGSVAFLLPSAKQVRAPRPARARELRPGAAEAPSAQQRGGAPSSRLLAGEVLLPPSLRPLVRPSVRGPLPPPPPQPRFRRASPPRLAAPLAGSRARGSLARSLPPPLPAPRGAEPGGPRAARRGPSLEGGGGGGAARAGRREQSRGGCETAPWAPDRSPLESGSGPTRERGAARQQRARWGGPRGRVPRACEGE